MATLGILCGLEREARALGGWRSHSRAIVGVTAGQPDRATRAAKRMVEEGCVRLLSWGIAGGLDPRLVPGDVMHPALVATADGARYRVSQDARIATGVTLLGGDGIVLRAVDKATLHTETGASAVDMESHRVAAVGDHSAVDVYVLRAIADPAERDLPEIVTDALDDAGRPRLAPVVRGGFRREARIGARRPRNRDMGGAIAARRAGARAALIAHQR
ncbi:MAG: hypothetical protein ACFBSD_09085, partial [Paracoccaceae bacterium]